MVRFSIGWFGCDPAGVKIGAVRISSIKSLYTIHALAVSEDNVLAHKSLRAALLRAGNHDGARESFEQALRIKPDWPPAQIGLSDAAYLSGKCAEAVEHYERMLAAQPHYAKLQAKLGCCYINLGRPAEALLHVEESYRLETRWESLTRALAIARDAH